MQAGYQHWIVFASYCGAGGRSSFTGSVAFFAGMDLDAQ
jgi:hypothetical protein